MFSISRNRFHALPSLAGLVAVLLCSGALGSLLAAPAQATVVGVNPDITWGISQDEVNQEVALVKQSGATWVRTTIDLSGAESAGPGQLNTSYLNSIDYAISAARNAGLNVLMEMDRTPYWASADPNKYTDASGTQHWNPYYRYSNPNEYAKIAGEVASHYKALGVNTYEVWNEPNNPTFWPSGVNAAEYTTMLKDAYPAIKAADPGATVVMGGLENQGSYEFLQSMYNDGARGSYDVANFHVYPGGNPTECPTESGDRPSVNSLCLLGGLRSEMAANGDNTPVWVTELGWSTCTEGYCVTEQQQAEYIVAAYQMLDSSTYSYVQNTFLYQMRDLYWETSNSSWESSLGLFTRNWTPKPAYAAFQAVATGASTSAWSLPGSSSTGGPTVKLTSPGTGARIGNSVTTSATASDPQGVTKVTFSIDGKVAATDTSAPYSASLSTSKLSQGSHTITATSYDGAGRTATSSVKVQKGSSRQGASTNLSVSLSVKQAKTPSLGAQAARATRAVRTAGSVHGATRGHVLLTLLRRVGHHWVHAGRRSMRLLRSGRFAGKLNLANGAWRVSAKYGSACSRAVTIRV
jgi:polysaccharide biosynthesis protein PslG